jgi:hypothetical protein
MMPTRILPLLLAFLLIACGGKKDEPREHIPSPAGPSGVTVQLSEPGGASPESIAFDGQGVTITYVDNGQAVLKGEARPS